jgi:hypothetical protein
LWGDIEEIADVVVAISKFLCKYKADIMTGTAIVDPEAEPIEDAILDGACAISEFDKVYDCAKDAINIIQQGK